MTKKKLMKMIRKKKNLLFIFSGVIGVVLVWRGIWGLMDTYLFPGHSEISYILSIIFGVVILLVDDFEMDELDGEFKHLRDQGHSKDSKHKKK